MNIEVTGCEDCLLRETMESGSHYCNHPKKNAYLYWDDNIDAVITPSDCPLFSEPLTLSIKQ